MFNNLLLLGLVEPVWSYLMWTLMGFQGGINDVKSIIYIDGNVSVGILIQGCECCAMGNPTGRKKKICRAFLNLIFNLPSVLQPAL